MTSYVFTDEEVRAVAEKLGLEFSVLEDGSKSIVGLPENERGFRDNPWKTSWKGELELNERGQLVVAGIVNLAKYLVWYLLEQRREPVIGFQVSECIEAQDFARLGKSAGMRVVCESGFTPWRVNFVPDVARAGETQWVSAKDEIALHEALRADPAQRPVVISVADLRALFDFIPNDGNPTAADLVNRLAKLIE